MLNCKVKRIVFFGLILCLGIGLFACSFPQPKPQEGVWYCEELKIEIDFSILAKNSDPYCAKKYNPDGTYQDVQCLFDFGSGITICSMDWTEDYLKGNFLYRNGVFSVTTRDEDKHTYVFKKVDK